VCPQKFKLGWLIGRVDQLAYSTLPKTWRAPFFSVTPCKHQTLILGIIGIAFCSYDVSDINDEYFARDKVSSSESEEQFFKGDAPKPAIVTDKRKADQKRIDAALLKSGMSGQIMWNGTLKVLRQLIETHPYGILSFGV
jgi:hypothetical protein